MTTTIDVPDGLILFSRALAEVGVHPIAQAVLESAVMRDDGTVVLAEAALVRMHGALRALHGSPELARAIVSVTALAMFLEEERRSPDAAEAVLRVVLASKEALDALLDSPHLPRARTEEKRRVHWSRVA